MWLLCDQFISRQSNQLLTMENVHLRFAYPIIIPSYAIRSYYICHISSHGPKYIGLEESENIITYSLRMHYLFDESQCKNRKDEGGRVMLDISKIYYV